MAATDPRSEVNAAGIGFMRTEIAVGLTFAEMASE
jgi:hypothetical protein